jgi:hypothetical protein
MTTRAVAPAVATAAVQLAVAAVRGDEWETWRLIVNADADTWADVIHAALTLMHELAVKLRTEDALAALDGLFVEIVHNDTAPGRGLAAQLILMHRATLNEPDDDTDIFIAEHWDLFHGFGATFFNSVLLAADAVDAEYHLEVVAAAMAIWGEVLPELKSDGAPLIERVAQQLWPDWGTR